MNLHRWLLLFFFGVGGAIGYAVYIYRVPLLVAGLVWLSCFIFAALLGQVAGELERRVK